MEKMSRYDVLLFDMYFCDLIVTGLPEIPRLGADIFGKGMGIHAGGTFNTVRALNRLEVEVGWACDFGNDLFSHYVLEEAHKEGVNESLFRLHDYPLRAFSLAFTFADDRGFISYMDPRPEVSLLPYVLEHRPRLVLLQHLRTGKELEELVTAAHEAGAQVLMDCQSTGVSLETPGVQEALRCVDVFLPNEGEAKQLTGAATAEEAAEKLAAFAPLVVVKLGSRGALARSAEGWTFAPSLPVHVLDTTGAGDCFNAGFLYAWLKGESLENCLRYGNICGGLSATATGTVGTPTREQAEEVFRTAFS